MLPLDSPPPAVNGWTYRYMKSFCESGFFLIQASRQRPFNPSVIFISFQYFWAKSDVCGDTLSQSIGGMNLRHPLVARAMENRAALKAFIKGVRFWSVGSPPVIETHRSFCSGGVIFSAAAASSSAVIVVAVWNRSPGRVDVPMV